MRGIRLRIALTHAQQKSFPFLLKSLRDVAVTPQNQRREPCHGESWTNPTLGGIANEHPLLSLRARLAECGKPSGRVDCRSRLGSFAMTNGR